MIYPRKTVVLKNGKEIILRAPEISDAAEMVTYLIDIATETEFLMNTPEEQKKRMSVELEESFLQIHRENPDACMIVVEIDGKIAGNCELRRDRHLRTRHRASIGIALLRPYWGMGIGTVLFEELIAMGREWGCRQLELEVYDANERAIALYTKMGFAVVATKPEAILFSDGSYHDEYIMLKKLV